VPRQQHADHRDSQAESGRHEEDQVVAGGEGGGRGTPAGLRRGSGAGGRREHRQAYRPAYLTGGVGQASDDPRVALGNVGGRRGHEGGEGSPMLTAMSSVGPSTLVT
jgi:hypothetical protein